MIVIVGFFLTCECAKNGILNNVNW